MLLNKEDLLSFEQLKNLYSSKNFLCEKDYFGYLYSYRKNTLYRLNCSQYSCAKCRPHLKHQLHDNVYQQVKFNDLNTHMVMTFGGSALRKEVSYWDSYQFMNDGWYLLRKVIKYKFPDFKYIIFPRAQANPIKNNPPGYCHFHVIHNKRIDKTWLESKLKKYRLGYSFLRHNEDVADYLHNDFFNDDEWIIPFNVKHYRSSRDIVINGSQGYCKDPDDILFPRSTKKDQIEHTLKTKYSRILPFEEYLKQFVEINRRINNEKM